MMVTMMVVVMTTTAMMYLITSFTNAFKYGIEFIISTVICSPGGTTLAISSHNFSCASV